MKFLPRSLGGQLALLMLSGFVLGHLFSTVGLWQDTGSLHPIARDHALSRTVTAYKLSQQQGTDEDRWLDSFNNRVAQLWMDKIPSTGGGSERDLALEDLLREKIPGSTVAVRMPCRDDAASKRLASTVEVEASELECVEINLAVGDGRWLHTRQLLPVQSLWRESWHLLRFSLLLGIPPVLILLYVFVNRILRPTTALTEAAERMSRGERIDPLTLRGPDEIQQIARAFNDMHERTTRFVDERTRMLAAISHDLRTPLTSLELQVAMLPESAERSDLLSTLEEVRQMVNETLSFATRNAKSESSEWIDLPALLREICLRHATLGRSIALSAFGQLPYRCRPLALRRALDNLTVNALRHGNHVSIVLSDLGKDGVRIDIADDGPGIPEDLLERVFEPFFQLDEARHRETGNSVGLGLAIARDSIQAHGGHLWLKNRVPTGLIAHIELPPTRTPAAG